MILAAAHQGEEFVIILPAIMLIGAFFIMRWANKPVEEEDGSAELKSVRQDTDDESASDEELLAAAAAHAAGAKSLAAVGQVVVEPQDEAHAHDYPDQHDRNGGGVAERLAERQHQ
jgi:hypothetical protein